MASRHYDDLLRKQQRDNECIDEMFRDHLRANKDSWVRAKLWLHHSQQWLRLSSWLRHPRQQLSCPSCTSSDGSGRRVHRRDASEHRRDHKTGSARHSQQWLRRPSWLRCPRSGYRGSVTQSFERSRCEQEQRDPSVSRVPPALTDDSPVINISSKDGLRTPAYLQGVTVVGKRGSSASAVSRCGS